MRRIIASIGYEISSRLSLQSHTSCDTFDRTASPVFDECAKQIGNHAADSVHVAVRCIRIRSVSLFVSFSMSISVSASALNVSAQVASQAQIHMYLITKLHVGNFVRIIVSLDLMILSLAHETFVIHH